MKTRFKSSQRSVPRGGGLSNRTIRTFLAEDDPMLMALLARIVSQHERVFIVGSAGNGRKALGYASSLQPDLVITDLNMPGMDGGELTRRLKELPHPPVVFVATAADTPEARARCLAAGANAFLLKSGNLAPRLLSAIQEFFPDHFEPAFTELKTLRESRITV